ncbi:restriction endonuclease subunit S [uncultured Maribacter sp.]|uniref:restriction endonuclease subunit S n=1 Tax=uncultured Maribacter sp. TaxID=431308 RepID=UPI0026080838|nr:restriction endonuclease subunit S [uncultured Maribacter sp.]
MAKQKNIPKLRFPEFNEDWSKGSLEKKNFSKGKGISKADIAENGETACIRYGELYTTYGETIDEVVSRTNVDKNELILSEANDVIIPASGESQLDIATASCVLKSGIALGGDLNIIKTENNGVFLSYYLNSKKKIEIARLAQGISVVHLYSTQLSQLELLLPKIPEQTKIASFFSTIDKKTQALKNNKELLEEYKKGVSQKLFSQAIRFKNDKGKDFPEWEELELSEFLIPTLREVSTPKDKYLAIGIRSHCKGTFQKPNSDPSKISMDKLFTVKENDLIVNITFAWEGAIALVKKKDEGGHVSHRFPTYTFNRDLVIHEFFQFVFVQKEFRNILDLISPGGAGRNRVLSKKEFLKIKWFFPKVDEQTKIADFLSSIDKKIGLIDKKLNDTEQWKKGLLQKMFC